MSRSIVWKSAGVVGVIVILGVAGYAWNESKARPDPPGWTTGGGLTPSVAPLTPRFTPNPGGVTPEPQSPVSAQCDDHGYPNSLPIRIGGVTLVPDLVMCANNARNEVTVENTSESKVWLLHDDSRDYWPLQRDLNKPLTTKLFRQSLRHRYARPYLTIEPGVKALLDGQPSELKFYLNAEEQTLWQSSALLAKTIDAAEDKYGDAVKDRAEELVSGTSKYRKAALDCGETAFDVGGKISAYQQDRSELVLEDVFGVLGDSTDCLNSLEEANDAAREERKVPLVEVNDIKRLGARSPWAEETDRVLRFVVKVGPKAAHLR